MFEPARRHELHADADPQERPPPLPDRLGQRLAACPGTAFRPRHAVRKGADAGQHDPVRGANPLRIGGHHDRRRDARFLGRALEGLVSRMQVAGPVIHDGDAHAMPSSGNMPITDGVSSR